MRHGGGYHVVRLKMPMVRSGLIISCMYRDMSRLRIRHGNSFSTFVMLRARSRCCIHCPCLILLVSVAATMACHVRRGVRMCVSVCVSVCVCVCACLCVCFACVFAFLAIAQLVAENLLLLSRSGRGTVWRAPLPC